MGYCEWAEINSMNQVYHDTEWGVPVHDDALMFEHLSLECLQCGLSWNLMLKKREIFRACFDGFDYERIAQYTDADCERILNTEGMLHARRKIEAIRNNAVCFCRIRREYGSFSSYLWSFTDGKTILYEGHEKGRIPVSNGLSARISRDLKKRGFRYVGPVNLYSHLQACGMIHDHDENCPCRKAIIGKYPTISLPRDEEVFPGQKTEAGTAGEVPLGQKKETDAAGSGLKYLPDGAVSQLSLNEYIVFSQRKDLEAYNGKRGKEIYSFETLCEQTASLFPEFDASGSQDATAFLSRMAEAAPDRVQSVIQSIADGMTAMISSLQCSSQKSREINALTQADWSFWKSCRHVYLVGRLAQGILGQWLEEDCGRRIHASDKIRIHCWQNPDGVTPSLLGCAKNAKKRSGTVYVFDFGNTAMKSGRAVFRDGIVSLEERPVTLHQLQRPDDSMEAAQTVHREITACILDTIDAYREEQEQITVSLCMANNIMNGVLMNRGHYSCLRQLAPQYSAYLKEALEQETGKSFTVRMINDAAAAAVLFSESAPCAAVITLGTRLGIAYPKMNTETKK